jgi:uncharacterized protein (TIGR02996 family)
MNRHKAFVEAICRESEDDALRLIYADWLDEQGDPRGEFIRVQFALRDLPEDDPRRPQLAERERDLLLAYQEQWTAPLGGRARRYEFRRGFVEKVTLTPQEFLANAEGLYRVAPVQEVGFLPQIPYNLFPEMLSQPRQEIAHLADCPDLNRLTGLDFRHMNLNRAELATLAASPHLDRLTSLQLNLRERSSVQALVEAPFLAQQVTTLCLDADYYPPTATESADVLDDLFTSPSLARLKTLEVHKNPLSPAEIRALAGSPYLSQLTTLRLRGTGLGMGDLALLGEASQLPNLSNLDLGGNRFGVETAGVLMTASLFDRLTRLDLSGNPIGPTGAQALTAAGLPRLRSLKLGMARLGDDGLRALAGAPGLEGLTTLSVSYNKIGVDGLEAFAAAPPGRLALLDLSWNPLGDDAVRALAASAGLASLQALDLSYAEVGDAGAEALAGSPHLTELRYLNLAANRVTDAGARVLAASPHLARLETLNLTDNRLSQDCVQELRRRFRGPRGG